MLEGTEVSFCGHGSSNKSPVPPPAKVLLIAPMIADVDVVLKKFKKFGEAITSVITPES